MRSKVTEILQSDDDSVYCAKLLKRECIRLILVKLNKYGPDMMSELIGQQQGTGCIPGKHADVRIYPELHRIARYDGANLHLNVSKMCRPALDWLDDYHFQEYEDGYFEPYRTSTHE